MDKLTTMKVIANGKYELLASMAKVPLAGYWCKRGNTTGVLYTLNNPCLWTAASRVVFAAAESFQDKNIIARNTDYPVAALVGEEVRNFTSIAEGLDVCGRVLERLSRQQDPRG